MPTANINILAVIVAAVLTFVLGAVWYSPVLFAKQWMALLASYTNSSTLAQGLWLGFLTWLGFAATVGLTANMFSEKPIAAWVLDAGYQLSYLVLMGVLLSLWR